MVKLLYSCYSDILRVTLTTSFHHLAPFKEQTENPRSIVWACFCTERRGDVDKLLENSFPGVEVMGSSEVYTEQAAFNICQVLSLSAYWSESWGGISSSQLRSLCVILYNSWNAGIGLFLPPSLTRQGIVLCWKKEVKVHHLFSLLFLSVSKNLPEPFFKWQNYILFDLEHWSARDWVDNILIYIHNIHLLSQCKTKYTYLINCFSCGNNGMTSEVVTSKYLA